MRLTLWPLFVLATLSISACSDKTRIKAGCPQGTLECDGLCRSIREDDTNCGSCGNACGEGLRCANAECLPVACSDTAVCATNHVCRDGKCESRTCVGLACDGNQVCVEGSCQPRDCAAQLCPNGFACVAGACVDAACAGVTCPLGQTCRQGVCTAVSCADGAQNGSETAVDCGGSCPPCADGKSCLGPTDCASKVCPAGWCAAPSCSDGVKNQDEVAADCGGSKCPGCAAGTPCGSANDCDSKVCLNRACAAATCSDRVKNGSESDVDCGGSACPPCAVSAQCGGPADCASTVCDGGLCLDASCGDRVKNGAETGVDCGGPLCPACPTGQPCAGPADCASGLCTNGLCVAPSCSDHVKNQGEADVDCGGPCLGCAVGLACVATLDCAGGLSCERGMCVAAPGGGCAKDSDCAGALLCTNGTCASGGCTEKTCVVSASGTTCQRVPAPSTTVCEDGRFCTASDHCDGNGACVGGTAPACPATTACATVTCNEASRACQTANKTNGSACNADDAGCTLGDSCQGGVCQAGALANCGALTTACAAGACQSLDAVNFKCVAAPLDAGTACSTGTYCQVNEACNGAGVCGGGAPRDCTAQLADQCNTGTCNEATKACVKTARADNTACDDGNGCTSVDVCRTGVCTGLSSTCMEERVGRIALDTSVATWRQIWQQPSLSPQGNGNVLLEWSAAAWNGGGYAGADWARTVSARGGLLNEEATWAPPPSAVGQACAGAYDRVFEWLDAVSANPADGSYLALGFTGQAGCNTAVTMCYGGGCSGCTFTGALTVQRRSAEGVQLASKNVVSWNASSAICGAWVNNVRGSFLTFSDGSTKLVEALFVSSFMQPITPDVKLIPLAADLTPGTAVSLVPAAKLKHGFSARVIPDGTDRFLVAWVAPDNSVRLQRFLKAGMADGAEMTIVAASANAASNVVVVPFGDGTSAVLWDIAAVDGNGMGVYGQWVDAAGTALSATFRVNANTAGDQRLSDAAAFSDGGLVVVYDDATGDGTGNGFGVRARLYKAGAVPDGNELAVNVNVAGDQMLPAVAVVENGEFVVAFIDRQHTSWVRRYNRNGTPALGVVDSRANTTVAGAQVSPKAAVSDASNVMVVYQSPVAGKATAQILGRVFDAAGAEVHAELQVNTESANAKTAPAVAGGPDRFVVAWTSLNQDGSGAGIYAQLFDGTGARVGGELLVNTTTTGNQTQPAVGMNAAGQFLVAWRGDSTTASDIFGRVFDKDGVELKGEFVINSTTTAAQQLPVVATIPVIGDFLVGWESMDLAQPQVMFRRVTSAGALASSEIRTDPANTYLQRGLSLAANASGGATACWDSFGQDAAANWGVYCQRYANAGLSPTPDGATFGAALISAGQQQSTAVTYLTDQSLVVAWASENLDPSAFGVQYQRFDTTGARVGHRVQANRYWNQSQASPFVVPLTAGPLFVGWQSEGQDTDLAGVYFRVFP